MHTHHILNEGDLKDLCPYCGKDVKDALWQSEFLCNRHYKITVCSCGRTLSVKVDFLGDGNDSWSGLCDEVLTDSTTVTEKKTIDEKVKS